MSGPIAAKTPGPEPSFVGGLARLVPGLLLAGVLLAASMGLATLEYVKLLGPLGVALIVGIAARVLLRKVPAAAAPGITLSGRTLLRLGIVLMGVRLDFDQLAKAGPRVFVLDLLVVGGVFAGVVALGRLLRVERSLAWLLAAGSAICGASAVAAFAPVARAKEEDVSVGIGVISLVGTLGVVGFTLAGNALQASPVPFGTLCGASLQEVAQVLAAAAARGDVAKDAATIAKLTRVLLLAPLVVGAGAFAFEPGSDGAGATGPAAGAKKRTWRDFVPPGFILGFLAVGAARLVGSRLGVLPESVIKVVTQASLVLMTTSMAAIGLGVDLAAIRRLGPRALGLGVLAGLVALGVAAAGMLALGLFAA